MPSDKRSASDAQPSRKLAASLKGAHVMTQQSNVDNTSVLMCIMAASRLVDGRRANVGYRPKAAVRISGPIGGHRPKADRRFWSNETAKWTLAAGVARGQLSAAIAGNADSARGQGFQNSTEPGAANCPDSVPGADLKGRAMFARREDLPCSPPTTLSCRTFALRAAATGIAQQKMPLFADTQHS
jgi:hypothetical protein